MKKMLAVLMLLLPGAMFALAQEDTVLLPSAAHEMLEKDVVAKYREFQAKRADDPDLVFELDSVYKQLAIDYLTKVRTSGIDAEEELVLARLLVIAERYSDALVLLEKLDSGSGDLAYSASIARMQILARTNEYASLEALLTEHWRRFTPNAETGAMAVSAVRELAEHYAAAGNHSKVIELVEMEMSRVPQELDVAYQAPTLLADSIESYIALGRRDDLIEMLQKHAAKYEAIVQARKDDIPRGTSAEERKVQRAFMAYVSMASRLESKAIHARLIGTPAPRIDFTRTYNTEGQTWESFKGKVVVLDFWANWCAPCKNAFPVLRELYADYREKGFVILGVTDLQGRFSDAGVREADITPEREIELTEELIARHNVTWPIVFSERGPFDPEYGVTGIPTMVFIDRSGNVRKIEVGFNPSKEDGVRQTIEALLEES